MHFINCSICRSNTSLNYIRLFVAFVLFLVFNWEAVQVCFFFFQRNEQDSLSLLCTCMLLLILLYLLKSRFWTQSSCRPTFFLFHPPKPPPFMLSWVYQSASEVSIFTTTLSVTMVTCNTLVHYGIRETTLSMIISV